MSEKVFTTKIQDNVINSARKKRLPVTVFLKNGQIVKGKIESFDQFTLEIETRSPNRNIKKSAYSLVYKSSILTMIISKKSRG